MTAAERGNYVPNGSHLPDDTVEDLTICHLAD
jgi:hypothetical protein